METLTATQQLQE